MRNNEIGDIWVLKEYDPPFIIGDRFIIVFTNKNGLIYLRHIKANIDYGWIDTKLLHTYNKWEPLSFVNADEEMLRHNKR